MTKHIPKFAAVPFLVAMLMLIMLGSTIYGLRLLGIVLSENQMLVLNNANLQRNNTALYSRVTDLSNEASRWRSKAEENQQRIGTLAAKASRTEIAASARVEAGDVFDFDSERNTFQPPTILAAYPGGQDITEKTREENRRYQQASIAAFLKHFGGPISSIVRQAKSFGIDVSRLQRHMDAMANTMMFKLVGEDLNDIAEQLDPAAPGKPAKPAPEQLPPNRPEKPRQEQHFVPDLKSTRATSWITRNK